MASFMVEGPLIVQASNGKAGRTITASDGRQFWKDHPSLAAGRGCFVFGFRAAKGMKPCYIGKATKSFKQEVFTEHKRNKYNEALCSQSKGSPILFLVVLEKSRGPVNLLAIDEAESYLIQAGLEANQNHQKDRKTAVEKWGIKGVIRGGKGQPSTAARSLKQCLNL